MSKCTVSYNHASFSEKNCELNHAGEKKYKSKEAKKINPFVRRGRNERVRVNKQIETTKQGQQANVKIKVTDLLIRCEGGASEGTAPLYTDSHSKINKYIRKNGWLAMLL